MQNLDEIKYRNTLQFNWFMAYNLIQWFLWSVVLSLIPLSIKLILQVPRFETIQWYKFSSDAELAFVGVTLCATAAAQFFVSKAPKQYLGVMVTTCILVAFICAISYGAFFSDRLFKPDVTPQSVVESVEALNESLVSSDGISEEVRGMAERLIKSVNEANGQLRYSPSEIAINKASWVLFGLSFITSFLTIVALYKAENGQAS